MEIKRRNIKFRCITLGYVFLAWKPSVPGKADLDSMTARRRPLSLRKNSLESQSTIELSKIRWATVVYKLYSPECNAAK